MDEKIKVYCDTGANVKFLKPYLSYLIFYQYPYDSSHRSKKQQMVLTSASELTWGNAHSTWGESDSTWGDCRGSENYGEITNIVGKANNQEDILHLDSAHKTGCHIFITSDKTNISSKKDTLEPLCKFKIFFHHDEQEIIEYLLEMDRAV